MTVREELLKKYGQYHKIENMEDGCIADEFVYEIQQIIIKKLDEKINDLDNELLSNRPSDNEKYLGYKDVIARTQTELDNFKRELEK